MRIPVATYRLQFSPSFTFADARPVVAYLRDLGITEIYASPVSQPRAGSVHGYDVVNHNEINPDLGSPEAFTGLIAEAREAGLGWIQDVVPNHMAFDSANPMLRDVLENGPFSAFYRFFDIEWDHPYENIRDRVLAPFLGDFYGAALEKGEIQLAYDENGLSVHYFALAFPVRIESYAQVLIPHLHTLRRKLGKDHPDFIKIHGLLSLIKTRAPNDVAAERYDQIKFIKSMLWELYTGNPDIRRYVDKQIDMFNGTPGQPESFDRLDHLLAEQRFRLSFWKIAAEEINYRRFFNINELICLRMEHPEVFAHTHDLILRHVREGRFTGLRIDHIDGLYDPLGYLQALREQAGDVYLCVEKILAPGEELPEAWPVQGTTGYEFIVYLDGVWCERKNAAAFDRIYRKFAGMNARYAELAHAKKYLIIGRLMAGDVDNLAHLTKGIFSHYRHAGDITLYALRRAIVEVMSQLSVYRTYLGERDARASDRDYVQEAIRRAAVTSPTLRHELGFIEKFLLQDYPDHLREEDRKTWIHFTRRFQQYTGPLMAKGIEDTLFYVFNRLLALNEVGGSPESFGLEAEDFHVFARNRQERAPLSLNTTATHDTKRGEDARARLLVLSELPQEWDRHLKLWSRLNARKKSRIHGLTVPDRNDEYFFYQTLLGVWPLADADLPALTERVKAYIVKAVREAKVHTAWLKPDTEYEDAFVSFVDKALKPGDGNAFLKAFLPFQKKISAYGIWNSLARTAVKLTAPGVPDFYQGGELWDFNLVDPDNRRPVDFQRRAVYLQMLRETRSTPAELSAELVNGREDGRIKLFLIQRGLTFRGERAALFQKGRYLPLETHGSHARRVLAFARVLDARWSLTVVPRFLTGLVKEGEPPLGEATWGDTAVLLPEEAPRRWTNALTGESLEAGGRLPAGRLFSAFPAAILGDEGAGA